MRHSHPILLQPSCVELKNGAKLLCSIARGQDVNPISTVPPLPCRILMHETRSLRARQLRRGVWLSAATVAWNLAEAVVALIAGATAHSIALVAFGMDSFIETTSAAVVGWRLVRELHGNSGEQTARIERRTSRLAGGLLLLLGAYIIVDASGRACSVSS